MAAFSSGMPSTSVYLVLPSRMALMAASLMWSGVSKSGSPASSEMMSRPAARRARALVLAAAVAEGLTRRRPADSANIDFDSSGGREARRCVGRKAPLDNRLVHPKRRSRYEATRQGPALAIGEAEMGRKRVLAQAATLAIATAVPWAASPAPSVSLAQPIKHYLPAEFAPTNAHDP